MNMEADLAAIEAALKVANRKTDIFDAAWSAMRRLRAPSPSVGVDPASQAFAILDEMGRKLLRVVEAFHNDKDEDLEIDAVWCLNRIDPLVKIIHRLRATLGTPPSQGATAPTERIHCYKCGKSVSTPVPTGTVVRAFIECPECIEKSAPTAQAAPGVREAVLKVISDVMIPALNGQEPRYRYDGFIRWGAVQQDLADRITALLTPPPESPAPAPRGEGVALGQVDYFAMLQIAQNAIQAILDDLAHGRATKVSIGTIAQAALASTPTLPAAAGGGEVRECWVEWLGDRPINVFRNLPNDSQRNPGWNLIRMVEAPVVDEDGREECPHGTPMRYALNCMKCIIGEGGRT
jgi:hypothetical protein